MSYAAGPAPEATLPSARVAFVDSGLGFVAYADALLALRPDLRVVVSLDPDHMPYGPRTPEDVRALILESARAARACEPDAIVVACNTASVHGLEALRAEFEPDIPIIGTVPAVRPAASTGGPVAVWATAATTASQYLRGLIDAFAADIDVTPVAAHGLAEAIEHADSRGVSGAIARAVAATPRGTRALVLGCTHYGLVADQIAAALGPEVTIFDSPVAVARQTLRRLGLEPAVATWEPAADATVLAREGGVERVLLSGRPGQLPATLAAYPAGARLLAADQSPS